METQVGLAHGMHLFRGMPADHRQSLGKWGEDRACQELVRRGYAVLARRYRTRVGEIDIVARDGDTVVFVEVKARTDRRFGGGEAAITPWKQRRMAHMAVDFLARARLGARPCRFDVVVVDLETDSVRVDVFVNAFDAPPSFYV